MDKISLLNHSVGVLCDNVRQNATKVILSSSPQNVMKLGASRRAFSFEGRQELAPVKAFKCKRPTASGRELHGVCKGPSGKEQRKGTRSVANLITSLLSRTSRHKRLKSDVLRILFRENVLSGTRCTILYVLFQENVLDGTK